MEFRKSYMLSLQDYLSYNRFSHRKQLIMMPALFLVLMLAVCIFIVFADRTPDIVTLAVIILLIVLFAGLIALSNILALNHQAKRQYRSSHSLKSEFELTMDKDGVRESSSSFTSNAKWDQVIYAVESKNAFYIHMSTLQAFVIPKALLNPNEDALIRKLLRTHLNGKKCRIKH
jgi:hypothetical protein